MIKALVPPILHQSAAASLFVQRQQFTSLLTTTMSVQSRKRTRKPTRASPLKRSRRGAIRLDRSFYKAPSQALAENLLGKFLVRRLEDGTILKGRIVETECYPGGDDKGSSTYKGRRTPANEPLYMTPGTVFVYMTYGMYHCMNISSEEAGGGAFIRALEPIDGIEKMRELRLAKVRSGRDLSAKELCAGPSKLCTSLNIEKVICNKLDLVQSNLMWLEEDPAAKKKDVQVVRTTRIGINSAGKEAVERPYRFYIYENECVSQRDVLKEARFAQQGLDVPCTCIMCYPTTIRQS